MEDHAPKLILNSSVAASSLSPNMDPSSLYWNGNMDENHWRSQIKLHPMLSTFSGSDADENPNKMGRSSCAGSGKEKGEKKVKKPRFAFQTRSQVDVLDDGYRWRKYGQKAVKNNKFPRSYYRCTREGCNVKKQVQRLSRDESVVVTTYEGTHAHPVDKPTDNFEQILTQMHIIAPF